MCLPGRRADAQKVNWSILWLAADETSYVTGSVLMGDGGQFSKRDKGRRTNGALDFLLRPATMTSRQYSGTKFL